MSLAETPTLSDCPECQRLRAALKVAHELIAALQAQVGLIQAQVDDLNQLVNDLQEQLRRNSSNSSIPPSANPPNAPKPAPKPPSGRKRGGQPGHRGHHRLRLPPERVNFYVHDRPTVCEGCQAPLSHDKGPDDPEPSWHQVVEVPKLAAIVTEHQAHTRTCSGCGHVNCRAIPPEVRAHVIGPDLTAALSYLSGRFHLSKRSVLELVEALFDAKVSLGTIVALEEETASALACAYEEVRKGVETAPVKNVDETGWKQAGAKRWLWVAVTATIAFFQVHAQRGGRGLRALLGATIQGTIISDRWSAYTKWPLKQRQICWSHLIRDFKKCSERGEAGKRLGSAAAMVIAEVFSLWHDFRQRELIDRERLKFELRPLKEELRKALKKGAACADKKVNRFSRNLLKLYPTLWLFEDLEGVEPTNNHAERALRGGVLWRKNSFGSQSDSGCRFVERMLSAVGTLRLQGRPVFPFLAESVRAYRAGTPGPALLVPKTD